MAFWPSLLYSGGPKSSSEAMSYVKCTIPLRLGSIVDWKLGVGLNLRIKEMRLYIFRPNLWYKKSCIQIRETLTFSTYADRSTHTIFKDISFNQKYPGYSHLGVISFQEKNLRILFKLCHHRQILWIRHLTKSLHDTLPSFS